MATADLTTSRLEELLGDDAAACSSTSARPSPAVAPAPARARLRRPRLRRHATATANVLRNLQWLRELAAASPAPATSRSSRSTRASSTPAARASRRTRSTSTRRTSCELAIEGGCNAFASTFGVLGAVSRQVGAQVPLHREAQPQRAAHRTPTRTTRSSSARCSGAWDLGAAGVGATIYFGSTSRAGRSSRSPRPSRRPTGSACSPCCGATCATRRFKVGRHRLPPRRRPHRPGQPPRRDDRGGHHQAEAAREQRRLQRRSTRTAGRTARRTS